MQFVPFTFCSDVVGHHEDLEHFAVFPANSAWNSAVSTHRERREVFQLELTNTADPDVWRYGFFDAPFSLEDLLARDPRYTRVRFFSFMTVSDDSYYDISLDDLHSKLIPFVIERFLYGAGEPRLSFHSPPTDLNAGNLATVNSIVRRFQDLDRVGYLRLWNYGETTEKALEQFLLKKGLFGVKLDGNWKKESFVQLMRRTKQSAIRSFQFLKSDLDFDAEMMAEFIAAWRDGDFRGKEIYLSAKTFPSADALCALMPDADLGGMGRHWVRSNKHKGILTISRDVNHSYNDNRNWIQVKPYV